MFHTAQSARPQARSRHVEPFDHLKPGRPAHDAQDEARLKAEIKARYQQPHKDENPQRHLALLRMHDIEAMLRASDVPADGGWEFLTAAAHHIAFIYRKTAAKTAAIVMWSRRFTPSIPSDNAKLLAERIIADPRMPSADKLGRRLGLTIEMRAELSVTTIGAIGMSKAQRLALRKQKRNEADRQRRAAHSSGKPRGRPSIGKPWEAIGISRRTWYRRKRKDVALQQDVEVSRCGTKTRGQRSLSIYAGLAISCHRPQRVPAPVPPTSGASGSPAPQRGLPRGVRGFVPIVHLAPSSLHEVQP
jgi:hypothetical protein